MSTANIKTVKKCAFCKYWYDPTNSAISPRSTKINLWEYDDKAKMKCLQKNYDMKASAFCGKYECKLEVIGKQQYDDCPYCHELGKPMGGILESILGKKKDT